MCEEITPQMAAALKIMQMNNQELADRIMRAIESGLSAKATLILVEELQRRLVSGEEP